MKNNTIEIPALQFDEAGELIITPSPTSSKDDFNFYVGKWQLRNRKLKTRLNNCEEWEEFDSTEEMYTVLQGLGNVDHFRATFDGVPFEGLTVRLFNPNTRLWSIYWADTNRGELDVPVKGSFDNNVGLFFTKDVFDGKNIVVAFCWDARDKENPIWRQAFSDNNGETWEWNWYMYFSR